MWHGVSLQLILYYVFPTTNVKQKQQRLRLLCPWFSWHIQPRHLFLLSTFAYLHSQGNRRRPYGGLSKPCRPRRQYSMSQLWASSPSHVSAGYRSLTWSLLTRNLALSTTPETLRQTMRRESGTCSQLLAISISRPIICSERLGYGRALPTLLLGSAYKYFIFML